MNTRECFINPMEMEMQMQIKMEMLMEMEMDSQSRKNLEFGNDDEFNEIL